MLKLISYFENPVVMLSVLYFDVPAYIFFRKYLTFNNELIPCFLFDTFRVHDLFVDDFEFSSSSGIIVFFLHLSLSFLDIAELGFKLISILSRKS